ncbi:MAG: endonuclease/exonuclease/phosphatase family protein [Candidatus Latescibacteria bacterium]|jgi:endonuclease/exonuclease/phosphatase family metal-dependent hydrolase|nr:endonuclease/exonuclease/phosphatase family protein [Candidatus Latescibacterota bacterium]
MLRIVTHNAYWFQGAPSLWGAEAQHMHPRAYAALIALYRRQSPDVLCLQEVPGFQLYSQLCSDLQMTGHYTPGGIFAAYGGVVLIRGLSADFRDCSRDSVVPGRVFERSNQRVRFDADGRELWLVNAHLQSRRYAPNRNATPLQLQEVSRVMAYEPRPDILLGDLNFRRGTEVYEHVEQLGYVDTAACAGCDDLEERSVDHIFVSLDLAPHVKENYRITGPEFEVEVDGNTHRLSDHDPVVAELEL